MLFRKILYETMVFSTVLPGHFMRKSVFYSEEAATCSNILNSRINPVIWYWILLVTVMKTLQAIFKGLHRNWKDRRQERDREAGWKDRGMRD